jgi:hypothetical protein
MDAMKSMVILAFVAIVGSLAAALYFMMRGGASSDSADTANDLRARPNHMARALALRVAFSIALFACILLAWKLGYLQPTGIKAGA